jgi:YVTN family beta-propeller protein
VPVGNYPYGVAVTPDGTKAYVTNEGSNNVSVIDTATENVTATVPVGNYPYEVAVSPDGTKVYVTNDGSNTVSVIDTATNNITATVNANGFNYPYGVAVSPDGTKVYVTNDGSNNVSVIDAATENITAGVPVGNYPYGVAFSPDGTKVYVANSNDNTVSVIDTATNNVTATVPVGNGGRGHHGGNYPYGVAVSPDGTKVYVTNEGSNTVSVIDTATNNVTASVPVGINPQGIAVTPEGTEVYVVNSNDNTISVIDTVTDNVTATVPVGSNPSTFGQFIGPILLTYKITPAITWSNPADIVYGIPLSSTQLDATATDPISGHTVSGTFVYTPPSGTVLSTGMHILNVSFIPTDIINYNNASASVSINVSVLGNFIYIPPTGTVLSAGIDKLNVSFIPTDTANYTTASATTLIKVTKATPTIIWNKPADIVYGTPLSSTQLNATASVPGTFVYTPSSGTKLIAGMHTLNVSFTPTDTTNYTKVSASVLINITQMTPTISWSNPTNITFGTPLSSIQLDATASNAVSGVKVPGTFVYTPPSGTVLGAGTYTLDVSFAPTDTTDYTTSSADALVNVTKETPTIIWKNPANIVYGTLLSSTQLDATVSAP